jgi:phosphocarrier protein
MTQKVLIKNKFGLHLRAVARLVKVAGQFNSSIEVRHQGKSVNAKSLLGLMTMAVGRGSELEFCAEGPQAAEALKAIGDLVGANFGERE